MFHQTVKRSKIMKNTQTEQNVISQLQIALKTCFKELSRIESLFQVKIEESTDIDALSESYKVNIAGNDYTLLVEYKSNGQPRFAKGVVNHSKFAAIQNSKEYWIFCAPFISAESARICKEAGIGYLDLAGNCYIKMPGVFINIEGKENIYKEKRVLKSLFSKKASRVVRVLLTDPNMSFKTDELQSLAKVSLGLVSKVTKKLIDQNWGRREKNGFKLIEPELLLREWSKSYLIKKEQINYFYLMGDNQAGADELIINYCVKNGLKYALTLYSAASRVAPYVRYEGVFAYIDFNIDILAKSLGLKPVFSGANVILIKPDDEFVFYDVGITNGLSIISPIQLFLDLKSYGGRAEDAAEFYFEEVIAPTWKVKQG